MKGIKIMYILVYLSGVVMCPLNMYIGISVDEGGAFNVAFSLFLVVVLFNGSRTFTSILKGELE